jgi:3-dehydroshikimate dehydratase
MSAVRTMIAVAAVVSWCAAAAAEAAMYTVTTTNDAGPGSLRQAILDSNRTTGPNVIEIDLPAAAAPPVIMPERQFLPPINGPAVVRSRGGAVILDGSRPVKPRTPADCPGATAVYDANANLWRTSRATGSGPGARGYYGAGLAIHDSRDVEISGLEIRNFCVGLAVVRSHGVYLHDLKIDDNHGAAGVLFTGDDGQGTATAGSYDNRLVNSVLADNGNGVEFTGGTHDSLLQDTTIELTRPLPQNGSAVELESPGDGNALIGNTFARYVETAVTVGGANQTIRDNRFTDNRTDGLHASGAGLLVFGNTFTGNGGDAMSIGGPGSRVMDNLVSGNAGRGIVVATAGVTLARNAMHGNRRLGIDSTAKDAGVPPVLDPSSTWTPERLIVKGHLAARPNQRFAIEIFASRTADVHEGDERGWGEGEMYLRTAVALTDAAGAATFTLMLTIPDLLGAGETSAFFSATATDAAGSTSRFSRSLKGSSPLRCGRGCPTSGCPSGSTPMSAGGTHACFESSGA